MKKETWIDHINKYLYETYNEYLKLFIDKEFVFNKEFFNLFIKNKLNLDEEEEKQFNIIISRFFNNSMIIDLSSLNKDDIIFLERSKKLIDKQLNNKLVFSINDKNTSLLAIYPTVKQIFEIKDTVGNSKYLDDIEEIRDKFNKKVEKIMERLGYSDKNLTEKKDDQKDELRKFLEGDMK